MDDDEWLAGQFERHRPHLRALACWMLGRCLLRRAKPPSSGAWSREREKSSVVPAAGQKGFETLGQSAWSRRLRPRAASC